MSAIIHCKPNNSNRKDGYEPILEAGAHSSGCTPIVWRRDISIVAVGIMVESNSSEHPWGTIKRQRGFDHVLTRGKTKVLGEVSSIFIGFNLARCAIILEGLEKLLALIYKHMNANNLLNRLQTVYFKRFCRVVVLQPSFSAAKF